PQPSGSPQVRASGSRGSPSPRPARSTTRARPCASPRTWAGPTCPSARSSPPASAPITLRSRWRTTRSCRLSRKRPGWRAAASPIWSTSPATSAWARASLGGWESVGGYEAVCAGPDRDHPARSGRLPMLERLARIRELLEADDPHLHARFTARVEVLVRGVGVLADVLNPQAIVLGG